MSIEEAVTDAVPAFVRRQVRDVIVENCPDTFTFSISVWAVDRDHEADIP